MVKVNPTQNRQEKYVFGGVQMAADQVESYNQTHKNGYNIFEVKFKNGVTVQFNDQTDSKLKKQRFQDIGAIFMKNNEIYLYNIHGGQVKGTPRSEYIELHLCRNFDVDGNGGGDSYYSYQDVPYSQNNYKMHVGDYYQKCGSNAFENINFYKILPKERTSATFEEFSITDNKKHHDQEKMMLEEQKIIDKQKEENYKKNSKLEIKPIEAKTLSPEEKERILRIANEHQIQIEYYKLRDESYKDISLKVEAIKPEQLTLGKLYSILSKQNDNMDNQI